MLDRKQILEADDLPREEVQVPEWGGSVFVRTLTGTERDAFEQSIVEARSKVNLTNVRAKLCARSIVDAEGKRVFDDGDAIQLGQKSSLALDRLFDVAQRLSGLSDTDVEELVKNSSNGQGEDSTSD